MTYKVTITVENAPQLGSTEIVVDAADAESAEVEAIRLMSEKWAVGGKWVAHAHAAQS